MDYLEYMPWIWLALFVILLMIEAFSMSLITIWGAVSSLLLVFISLIRMPLLLQICIFLFISFLLFFTTRPFALKKLKMGKYKTNLDSLIGQEVKIKAPVGKFEKGEGETRNGVIWTVTSVDGTSININSTCKIVGIEGNTLIVKEIF